MGLACFNLHVANDTVADIVKQIRTHLGLSHGALAKKAGLDRIEIVKLEKGDNKATTERMRTALATGFGLPRDVLSAVLDGAISADVAIQSIGKAEQARTLRLVKPARTTTREDPYPSRRSFLILARARGFEEAVLEVLESELHHAGDPGDDYWEGRYVEVKARFNRMATLDRADDASDDEVKRRREAAKKKD